MGRPALGRAAVRPVAESLLALLALEAQLELMELLLLGGPLLQPRRFAEEAMQLAANVGGARAVAILQKPALRVLANAQASDGVVFLVLERVCLKLNSPAGLGDRVQTSDLSCNGQGRRRHRRQPVAARRPLASAGI